MTYLCAISISTEEIFPSPLVSPLTTICVLLTAVLPLYTTTFIPVPIFPEVTSLPAESVTFMVYPPGALTLDLKDETDVLKSTPVIYVPTLYSELTGLIPEFVSLATVI